MRALVEHKDNRGWVVRYKCNERGCKRTRTWGGQPKRGIDANADTLDVDPIRLVCEGAGMVVAPENYNKALRWMQKHNPISLLCLEGLNKCPKCGMPMSRYREIRHASEGKRAGQVRTRYVCHPCHNEHVRQKRGVGERGEIQLAQRHLTKEERARRNRRRTEERRRKKQLESKGWRKAYLHKYGLTQEAYIELLEKQDYKCPFCGKRHRYKEWAELPPAKGISNHSGRKHVHNYLLVVDHDHDTGEVRGLLCSECNVIEGHISWALKKGLSLQAFVDYAQQHGEVNRNAA